MVPSSLLFECSLPLHLRIIRVGRPHVALIRRVLKSVAVKVLPLPCWKMPLCPRMMRSLAPTWYAMAAARDPSEPSSWAHSRAAYYGAGCLARPWWPPYPVESSADNPTAEGHTAMLPSRFNLGPSTL